MRLRTALLASVLFIPSLASAQEPGVAVNMGRGLDNGMSVGWTFKENWTLRPTIAAAYSQQGGFQAAIGSTLLRSISLGERFYAYAGAGIYYGSANSGLGGRNNPIGVTGQPGATGSSGGNVRTNAINSSLYASTPAIAYVTAPAGVRARVKGNFELFAEAAYQRTLTGQFGLSQAGQFSNNGRERFGATFGLSMRVR